MASRYLLSGPPVAGPASVQYRAGVLGPCVAEFSSTSGSVDAPSLDITNPKVGGRTYGMPRSLSQVSTAASLGTDDRKGGRAVVLEEVRKYAFCPADLGVLARFLDLQLFDGHKTIAFSPPKEVLRLVLRAMKLLHLCDFQHEDICCILAHTSVYFRSTYKMCGHQMDAQEVANAIVAQMFIAQSYVQDETCPLRVWHEHVFHKYCSLKTLNAVVMRLLLIRGYRLRLDRKDMLKRYKYLVGSQPPDIHGLATQLEAASEHTRSSSCGSSPRCPDDQAQDVG